MTWYNGLPSVRSTKKTATNHHKALSPLIGGATCNRRFKFQDQILLALMMLMRLMMLMIRW